MLLDKKLKGLVRLHGISIEHYDGKEVWNANWSGARQTYMDIIGMGGFWHLYHEINVEEVEEIKRVVDEEYKKKGGVAYKGSDSDCIDSNNLPD